MGMAETKERRLGEAIYQGGLFLVLIYLPEYLHICVDVIIYYPEIGQTPER